MSMVAAFEDERRELPASGSARAAILLLALGSEGATRVLQHFSPEEIRLLKESAEALNSVAPEAIEALVDAFQEAFKRAPGLEGPSEQMEELLQNALGEEGFRSLFQQEDLTAQFAQMAAARSVWDAFADLDAGEIAPLLAQGTSAGDRRPPGTGSLGTRGGDRARLRAAAAPRRHAADADAEAAVGRHHRAVRDACARSLSRRQRHGRAGRHATPSSRRSSTGSTRRSRRSSSRPCAPRSRATPTT